jgi:intracellular septation protein A
MASHGLAPSSVALECSTLEVAVPRADAPGLGAIVTRVAQSLLIACVAPIALFYVCFAALGLIPAMLAALAWSYGALAIRKATGRRTSGLLVLVTMVLTARTVVALAADSSFIYFLQPIISDAVVGLVFLISLAGSTPVVARLAGDFYPMDDEVAARPPIRQLFRRLTAMWSAVILGKAAFVLWLLLSQTLETFVMVQGISVISLTIVTTTVTIAVAAVVAQREGLISTRSSMRLTPAI